MTVASCENHAGREAIGLCVACRRRVCGECATKVEGINYCVRCLGAIAAEGGRLVGARRGRSRTLTQASVALQVGLLSLALAAMLHALLPG